MNGAHAASSALREGHNLASYRFIEVFDENLSQHASLLVTPGDDRVDPPAGDDHAALPTRHPYHATDRVRAADNTSARHFGDRAATTSTTTPNVRAYGDPAVPADIVLPASTRTATLVAASSATVHPGPPPPTPAAATAQLAVTSSAVHELCVHPNPPNPELNPTALTQSPPVPCPTTRPSWRPLARHHHDVHRRRLGAPVPAALAPALRALQPPLPSLSDSATSTDEGEHSTVSTPQQSSNIRPSDIVIDTPGQGERAYSSATTNDATDAFIHKRRFTQTSPSRTTDDLDEARRTYCGTLPTHADQHEAPVGLATALDASHERHACQTRSTAQVNLSTAYLRYPLDGVHELAGSHAPATNDHKPLLSPLDSVTNTDEGEHPNSLRLSNIRLDDIANGDNNSVYTSEHHGKHSASSSAINHDATAASPLANNYNADVATGAIPVPPATGASINALPSTMTDDTNKLRRSRGSLPTRNMRYNMANPYASTNKSFSTAATSAAPHPSPCAEGPLYIAATVHYAAAEPTAGPRSTVITRTALIDHAPWSSTRFGSIAGSSANNVGITPFWQHDQHRAHAQHDQHRAHARVDAAAGVWDPADANKTSPTAAPKAASHSSLHGKKHVQHTATNHHATTEPTVGSCPTDTGTPTPNLTLRPPATADSNNVDADRLDFNKSTSLLPQPRPPYPRRRLTLRPAQRSTYLSINCCQTQKRNRRSSD